MADTKKSHRPRVIETATAWVAVCSCGWITDDKKTEAEARTASNSHLVTELRKKN